MIVPMRCFTCGKVISNKWEHYQKKVAELQPKKDQKHPEHFDGIHTGKILDDIGLDRLCCRRMMISHVDIDM